MTPNAAADGIPPRHLAVRLRALAEGRAIDVHDAL